MTESKENPAGKFLAQRGVIPDHQKAVADELVNLRYSIKQLEAAITQTNLKLSSIMVRLDMPRKGPGLIHGGFNELPVAEKSGCNCG